MKEYGKTFAELSFAFRFLSCCSFGGFCCYFCWLSEVYRLAHKSFVACSNSRYCCLLLFFKSRWLDLQLIAALCCCCCLTLKQLTVFLLPSISRFRSFREFFSHWLRWKAALKRSVSQWRCKQLVFVGWIVVLTPFGSWFILCRLSKDWQRDCYSMLFSASYRLKKYWKRN